MLIILLFYSNILSFPWLHWLIFWCVDNLFTSDSINKQYEQYEVILLCVWCVVWIYITNNVCNMDISDLYVHEQLWRMLATLRVN